MEERSRVALSVLVGAALGGVVGYLLFTEDGRRLRTNLRGHVEGLVDDASRFRGSIEKLRDVASDGWRSVTGALSSLGGDEEPPGKQDRGMRVS